MRARSSTGWTSGAATYDSGLVAHNLNRPAPRCSALLSGLVLDSHLVPSPVAFSRSQTAHGYRTWPGTASSNARYPQHNHARYDHLGSVRLITDQNAQVVSRHDYLPFGEEIPNGSGGRSGNGFGAASSVNQMFTGQERDGEMTPNVDFLNARYFMGVLGC